MNSEFPLGSADEFYQDAEGFLWIGTVNGLLRYDGYHMRTFTHDPGDITSIGANNINAIGQDSRGRLWVGFNSFGLDVLDQELNTFQHIRLPGNPESQMQKISVQDISADGVHVMWLATTQGLFKFNTDDSPQCIGAYYHDEHDAHSLTSNTVLSTFIDSYNRLWIGTDKGINLFDRTTSRFINHRTNSSFPDQQTLDIAEDRQGNIWLSTRVIDECLLLYNENTGLFDVLPEYRNRKLGEFYITFDLANDLWISARGAGAYQVDSESGRRIFFNADNRSPDGYRNVYGLNAITDKFGNVWMAGNFPVKWPSTGKGIRNIRTPENQIFSVYANKDAIWYSNDQLWAYNQEDHITSVMLPDPLPTNIRMSSVREQQLKRIYSMLAYDEDHLLLSSTRNIFLWNLKTDTFKEFPTNFGGPFREILLSPDKKKLWICRNQGHPLYFDLATGQITTPEFVKEVLNPRCAVQEPNGNLWFGSGSYGVYAISAGAHEVVHFIPDHTDPTHRLSDYTINDLVIHGKEIWIATNLGLNKIDTDRKEAFIPGRNLPLLHESIKSLLVDANGILWAGSQRGLIRYDPIKQATILFDKADGLINSVFTEGACFKDEAGNLYFGGDQGIDFFDPENIGFNPIPPDLYLGQVLVNNIRADSSLSPHHLRNLTLSHSEKFIEIELLALHFTAPESNTYAYRIHELDTTWRNLGTNRTITLANMQPGTYTLEARAANADGVWSTNKNLLELTIRPPFWATAWFIIVCLITAGLVIYLGITYHVNQIKKRERLKSDFNRRANELESKALRVQMNPHFLFNSLNSLKSLISQGRNEKATQYLTRFGHLIRQILQNSEKPFVRLQEELEALKLYLDIEQLRFQNFSYEIKVDEDINTDFIEVPPLILQPYVENAIWHGLMHQNAGQRYLEVRVSKDGRILRLIIEDNGIGRQEAEKIKMLGKRTKAGLGMRVTGDRLQLLRRIYGEEVSIVVRDLYENGRPSGTSVEIGIPCLD